MLLSKETVENSGSHCASALLVLLTPLFLYVAPLCTQKDVTKITQNGISLVCEPEISTVSKDNKYLSLWLAASHYLIHQGIPYALHRGNSGINQRGRLHTSLLVSRTLLQAGFQLKSHITQVAHSTGKTGFERSEKPSWRLVSAEMRDIN